MSRNNDWKTIISRRSLVLGGLQLGAVSALVARLYYLQFLKFDTYSTQAEDNRIRLQIIPPSRGIITDRFNQPLATNTPFYRLLIERSKLETNKETLTLISKLISLTPDEYTSAAEKLKKTPKGHNVTIKNFLTWEDVSKLEFHTPDLPDVHINILELRHYPLSHHAAHLIGYVGRVSQKEMKPDQPLYRVPDFRIGKNGVERSYNENLVGNAGFRHLEVNANGIPLRLLKKQESERGEHTTLTIDNRLQEFCAKRMDGESGAAVVMDVNSGEVLALASVPAFDPNTFSKGITHNYWKELNDNPKFPLMDKSVTGQYPPGSTFKMIVALAALEGKIATERTQVRCPGHFYLGKHRFNCWRAGGHGSVNLNRALAESCDTYFYTLAHQLGIEKISEMARRFGLGEGFDIGLPSEKTGLLPSKEWKKKYRKQQWLPGDTINSSIGQGFVLSTPLQLAVMTARIATGRKVMPTLHRKQALPTSHPLHPEHPNYNHTTPPPSPSADFESLGINQSYLAQVRRGMNEVVNGKKGTARGSRLKIDEPTTVTMAGKTGTSQVKRITQRGMKQSLLPWKDRHHALFVGFAPYDEPRYAVSVLIEHGGGGSSAAAPVAHDIMEEIFHLERAEKAPEPLLDPTLGGDGATTTEQEEIAT